MRTEYVGYEDEVTKIQSVIDAGIVPRLIELLTNSNDEIVKGAVMVSGNLLAGTDIQICM